MAVLQKIKAGFGYLWASLCLVVILVTFIGLNSWERTLAKSTGIHISPRFSGGEIRQTIDHGVYQTLVHRMVFDGLIGERAEGFVQIDWVPSKHGALPGTLEEKLDINGDGSIEFDVRVETASGSVQLIRMAPWVLDAEPLITVDSERILRVLLRNPHK